MAKPRRFDWLFRPQLADEDLPLSAEALFAEALAELPAVERSALALSEIGGLDNDEIAERLGTDPLVVRRLLVRAAVGGTVRVEAVKAERRSVRPGRAFRATATWLSSRRRSRPSCASALRRRLLPPSRRRSP